MSDEETQVRVTITDDGEVQGPEGLDMEELVAFCRVYRAQKYLNELIGPEVLKRYGLEPMKPSVLRSIETYANQRLRGCSNTDEILVGTRCEVRTHPGGKLELRAYLPGWEKKFSEA